MLSSRPWWRRRPDAAPPRAHLLAALYERIVERQESGTEASYVWRLTQRGQDAICKKVVEEAAEVVLASKNGARPELVYEMADLWFHTLVLLGTHRVPPDEVLGELQRRFGKPGGGKPAAPGGVQPAEPAGS
ncbi:MAG: phosphoribosyl-ATP pyrophosphatase [Candidatus Tectimicrobiota bacterium]|nr:MAG: phosphoribosyl-ATP pyrophosphatase [Candidatus Tectomicrobia bacterium]